MRLPFSRVNLTVLQLGVVFDPVPDKDPGGADEITEVGCSSIGFVQ